MTLSTITGPAEEPLSVELVKAQLRIDDSDEDAVIAMQIASARSVVESYLRARLINQTVRLTLDGFPSRIELPIWPVQSITTVKYDDTAGDEQTIISTDYQLIESRKPNLVAPAYLGTWPIARADFDSVRIEFVVGYGATGNDVPADIRQAMLMLIGDFFENRENTIVGMTPAEMPFGVKALLSPHIFWV